MFNLSHRDDDEYMNPESTARSVHLWQRSYSPFWVNGKLEVFMGYSCGNIQQAIKNVSIELG